MESEQNDPVIDEIRDVRHRISERFGHDPAKLVAYYMELQEKHRGQLIGAAKFAGNAVPPAAKDGTS